MLGGGLRDVRPLVVSSSCEFLASAMLHTCLKLQQPAAHAEKRMDQLTCSQPEAPLQAARFKSPCHSQLTLPLHLGRQVAGEINGIETNHVEILLLVSLSRCCDVAVKHPWRVTLWLMTAASSSPDRLPSLLCDRHISLVINLQLTFTKQTSQQDPMVP